MQMSSMGYFIFTLPLQVRYRYRTQESLASLGRDIDKLLKSFGYLRSLRRWHWFGETGEEYHPHLNVLVDGGFIPLSKLDEIKAAYAQLLGVSVADVNYHYRTSPGRMLHTLSYMTRATFLDYHWDDYWAHEVKGFRNMVVSGRGLWQMPPAWTLSQVEGKYQAELEGIDLEAIASLVQKKCPVCGQPVVWKQVLPFGLLKLVDKECYGAGYYRIVERAPPARLSWTIRERLRILKEKTDIMLRASSQEARLIEKQRHDSVFYQLPLVTSAAETPELAEDAWQGLPEAS